MTLSYRSAFCDRAAQADLTLSNFYLGADGIFVALGLSWQT